MSGMSLCDHRSQRPASKSGSVESASYSAWRIPLSALPPRAGRSPFLPWSSSSRYSNSPVARFALIVPLPWTLQNLRRCIGDYPAFLGEHAPMRVAAELTTTRLAGAFLLLAGSRTASFTPRNFSKYTARFESDNINSYFTFRFECPEWPALCCVIAMNVLCGVLRFSGDDALAT